jgi:hypothetical protein
VKFLIYNKSKLNVSVGDLHITIPAGKTIDLLNNKTGLTLEELQKSYSSGSLYKKRDKLVKVESIPQQIMLPIKVSNLATATDNPIGIKQEKTSIYDGLHDNYDVSDDEYIKQLIEQEQLMWNPHEKKKK